jgi:hypothetical protein
MHMVLNLYTAFDFLYVYNHMTQWCRQQAEVIHNHEKEHFRSVGQGRARHRKYKGLKLDSGQAYDRSSD